MEDKHEHLGPMLTAYLDGELPEKEHKEVEAHLKSCESCRALARELQETTDILKSAYATKAEPPVDLTGVWEEIEARVKFGPSLWQRVWQFFERPIVWLPAASVAAAAILLVLLLYPVHKQVPIQISQVESVYSSSGQVMVLQTARQGNPLIWILPGPGKEGGS